MKSARVALCAACALALACGDGGNADQGPRDGSVTPDSDIGDGGSRDAASSPDATVDIDIGDVTLEVGHGTSTDTFAVLTAGQTVEAVYGMQGGYHVDLGFRVRGLSAADFNSGAWIIEYIGRDASGEQFTERITRVLSLTGIAFDGVGQVRAGDRVILAEFDPTPRDLTTVSFEVWLRRDDGATIMDAESVILDIPGFP